MNDFTRFRTLLIALALATTSSCFSVPRTSQGALIFRFDKSNYVGNPGGTVDVKLSLEATNDTATGGPDHTVLFANGGMDGLFSVGVFVLNDNMADAASNGADVVSTSDIAINTTHFNDVGVGGVALTTTSVGPGTAGIRAISGDIVQGVQTGTTAPFIVDIATIRYTLGPSLGEVTTLTLADIDPALDDTIDVTVGANVYDAILDFSATATITAVPEPSSMLPMFGLLTLMTSRRRRRT